MSTSDRLPPIRILHVEDEPDFAELVKLYLEREDDRFEVVNETGPSDGLEHVKADGIDCIVSDYDMPEIDGLQFLDSVRAPFPDLPFILFTGKGSEEIASKAIRRGVTDYLQKGGSEQYEVLANIIRNSVDRFRTEHELERSRKFLDRMLDLSPAAVVVLDGAGSIILANELAETVLGLSKTELTDLPFNDEDWQIVGVDGSPIPDEALPFKQVLDSGEAVYGVKHGIKRPNGEPVWLSINAAPLWVEGDAVSHVVAVLTDESSAVAHERNREAAIRQLEGFGRVLSHDLGNILNIARGRLELARETGGDEHFETVDESLSRAEVMLDELTDAIKAGKVVGELIPVDLGTVFDQAWKTQDMAQATRSVEGIDPILADETALLRLFENLIRNTLEHGADTATIRVGDLPDGFYVEDDGPGIPEDVRETVFEPGYTTKDGGQGIGLVSIQQIALAHGWNVRITEGTDGGARFEFTNVERPSPAEAGESSPYTERLTAKDST